MAIDRRHFLTGTTLGLASALCPSFQMPVWASSPKSLLLAACKKSNGSYALTVLTSDGKIIRELPIQGRGHDFAYDKRTKNVVAFARRPGRFALSFNAQNQNPPTLFAPPIDRHFYGHGTFSSNGRILYTTENDFNASRGIIGVYDAKTNFTRIGEFSSHGIGPHDILLQPDGKTLAVANGGIETHPESGREKLNLTTMTPSLCFIDTTTGVLIAQHTLPESLHQLSVRHLTQDSNGTIWFGGQWEGEMENAPGLIGHANLDTPLKIIEPSEALGTELKGYIGSVAMSADQRWLAASAPRANQIVYFDTENPDRYHTTDIADACGLAQLGGSQFAVSSGTGTLRNESPNNGLQKSRRFPHRAFDNHMQSIS
ncbi:MAG: DUF1513 domain-containing protein [Hyphomicrobiaceae bacterium]